MLHTYNLFLLQNWFKSVQHNIILVKLHVYTEEHTYYEHVMSYIALF